MSPITNRIAAAVLGLCLTSAALVSAPARAAEVRRSSERMIPFAPGGSIRLQDKNGRISVEGWPRNDVHVEITRVVRHGDARKAEELIRELRSDIEVRNGKLVIESRFPKRKESIGLWEILGKKVAALQINYVLHVPTDTDLELGTSNGDVRIQGVNGRVEASTTNGDVRVASVRGTLVVGTTNGEIQLSNVSGSAAGRTTNGSIVAELRSVSPKGEIELTTTNGNVEMYVPGDLKADLEAVTTNGRVSIAFPIRTQGVITSKSIRGSINGGGPSVAVATTNGNIELRRLSQRRD